MRFSGLKMNDKSKGANTEITTGLGNLFLADVGILSCDLNGNSPCSRDLFCKEDQTTGRMWGAGERSHERASRPHFLGPVELGKRHSPGLIDVGISEEKIIY